MTAETAVVFPVVVLALTVVLLAGSLAQAGVLCVDGARTGARALSRGESEAVAVSQVVGVVGRPATVQVAGARTGAGVVSVTVRVEAGAGLAPAWAEGSWRLPVTCRAHAWQEPPAAGVSRPP